MQPAKKQLELLLMHYFRARNPDFPKGILMASESPDFILKLKTKNRIGIELTRLNPLNARIPDTDEEEQLKMRERIIGMARNLFCETSPYKLFVKFLFAENIHLEEEREIVLTARITNSVRQAVQFKKPTDFFYLTIDRESLPVGIENILIINHPGLEAPVWERSNNLGVSDDVVGDIRLAIQKKDEKLRLYQKQSLNYYWLVIVTDRLRGIKNFNLHDKIMNQVFYSRFQQVFLFDLIKAKVFQLV